MIARTLILALAALWGGLPVSGQDQTCVDGDGSWIAQACYENIPSAPTYGHDVLGDTPEWDALTIRFGQAAGKGAVTLRQDDHVFEDTSPRVMDLDGDGTPEIVAVQSSFDKGARLVVYGVAPKPGLLAATPYIGTSFRWLAPIGAADFNGDGDMDVAYVDRPHLAKTLRIWTYRDGGLTEIATLRGVTNHKIGEPYIASAIRTCDGRPEIILTDGARKNIVSIFFEHDRLKSRVLGRFSDRKSVDPAPPC